MLYKIIYVTDEHEQIQSDLHCPLPVIHSTINSDDGWLTQDVMLSAFFPLSGRPKYLSVQLALSRAETSKRNRPDEQVHTHTHTHKNSHRASFSVSALIHLSVRQMGHV